MESKFFVNATKIYQFKGKHTEIKDYALCLGNISKGFTIIIIQIIIIQIGLGWIVNYFFLDFNPTDTNNISYIH